MEKKRCQGEKPASGCGAGRGDGCRKIRQAATPAHPSSPWLHLELLTSFSEETANLFNSVIWKPGDSYFWDGIMATQKNFFSFGSFSIRNGSKIRFW
jgi:hypothetical protein